MSRTEPGPESGPLAGVPLEVPGLFRGGLGEFVAALERGLLDPAGAPLAEVLAQVQPRAADVDTAVEAFALLARAVELKARALLPEPPPAPAGAGAEDAAAGTEEEALAARLAEYRVFAEAAEALRAFEERQARRFARPASAAAGRGPGPGAGGQEAGGLDGGDAEEAAPGALPPRVARADLERLLAAFAEVWERARPRQAEVPRDRWTVAQALAGLRDRLRVLGAAEFAALFDAGADRLQVVVAFLALLELVRTGEVAVRQDEPFAPVRVEWRGRR